MKTDSFAVIGLFWGLILAGCASPEPYRTDTDSTSSSGHKMVDPDAPRGSQHWQLQGAQL